MVQASTRRFILVGDNPSARRLHESFQQFAPVGWEWLGAVTDDSTGADLGGKLGLTRDLADIVSRHGPTDIVLAIQSPGLLLWQTLLQLVSDGVRMTNVRTLHEELTHRVQVVGDNDVLDTTLDHLAHRRLGTCAAKRMLDLAAGACAFAAFTAALFPVALGLTLERAGSVFVRERRIGRLGQPFTLLRFRTIRNGDDRQHWPLVEAPVPIRTGAFIRRLGIDRLPLSFALLAGHLSLVGPRPAEVGYQQRVQREFPAFLARSAVKPGLLGWEQLHRESRSAADRIRQLEYDLYYIRHQSFGLDLRIILRSIFN